MNKKFLALSLTTLALGGALIGGIPKLDSVAYVATVNEVLAAVYSGFNRNNLENGLVVSEENQALIEQGYNNLTMEEKAFYNKYVRSSKVNLSEDELT